MREHLRGIGNFIRFKQSQFHLNTNFSVYTFIITILIYRNYDSTASLDAFCVEEGINSLNIDDGQGIEDISSIIDTGE